MTQSVSNDTPGPLTVYYDGACPLCRREIDFYRRRETDTPIDWVDVSRASSETVAPDLTRCGRAGPVSCSAAGRHAGVGRSRVLRIVGSDARFPSPGAHRANSRRAAGTRSAVPGISAGETTDTAVDAATGSARRLAIGRLITDTMQADKYCASCGRRMLPRKRWQHQWSEVRYCSSACRNRRIRPIDRQLEAAILALLSQHHPDASICPSEAARQVGTDDNWRDLMEPTRRAARRLAHRRLVDILQRGRAVDPGDFRGPIRIRVRT